MNAPDLKLAALVREGSPYPRCASWDGNGVNFALFSANATRVELEHRKFEQMGAEAGASMRNDVERGWPGMLERFKQHVETA